MNRILIAAAPYLVAAIAIGAVVMTRDSLREARAALAECSAYVAATGDAHNAIDDVPDDDAGLLDWLRDLSAGTR